MSRSPGCSPPHQALEDLLLALQLAPGIGRAAACRLGAEAALWAYRDLGTAAAALAHRLGVPPASLERARRLERQAAALARPERTRAAQLGARLVFSGDRDYPAGLRDLELPPLVLAVRGQLPSAPAVALVGARAANQHGITVARWLAGPLAAAGVTIVSGMAPGIDRAAHQAALAAGGQTVAWLGCGLDVDYPRGQQRLKSAIADSGAVASELPFGAPPLPENFPIRNRLIAAHAAATVVIQARARSGSLITARLALDLGREVLAVPSRLFDPRGEGPNQLLRDGARPVLDPSDVAAALPPEQRAAITFLDATAQAATDPEPASPLAERLWGELANGERTAEDLSRATGEPIVAVLEALLLLELDGRVRRGPGARYTRVPPAFAAG